MITTSSETIGTSIGPMIPIWTPGPKAAAVETPAFTNIDAKLVYVLDAFPDYEQSEMLGVFESLTDALNFWDNSPQKADHMNGRITKLNVK